MNKRLLKYVCYAQFCAASLLFSCESDKPQQAPKQNIIPKAVTTVSYNPRQGLTPEAQIEVSTRLANDSAATSEIQIDSVSASWKGKKLLTSLQSDFSLALKGITLGKQEILTTVFLSNGESERHYLRLTILAPAAPEQFSFRKVKTYTHDPDAYTQGLLAHNGYLYESTGQQGKSTLRKVEIETGKVVQQIHLDDKYFGEGITIYNDRIVQLTYKSNIGFVYDLETFESIKTFNYPTEGWGLAAMGDKLLMTDGSENIYFMDPSSYAETARIQVYDHEGKVDQLNELEIVNGKIYANVYQTDKIIIIDPATGMVEGEVNLEGILNKQGYNRELDVLNGIAWDENNNALYVTGKLWPKLFQIELIKIQS